MTTKIQPPQHLDTDCAKRPPLEILEELKQEALRRGRPAADVEEDRQASRAKGMTDMQIAASELAEQRFFDDFDEPDLHEAALAGTPSEVTIALAEREGYCLGCVRHWYGVWAQTFRENEQELRAAIES